MQKHRFRKPVTRNVLRRDAVPTEVFNRYARLLTHQFESHFDFGRLAFAEGRLAPGEPQPMGRLPDDDAPDLEHRAVGQRFGEAPAGLRIEGHRAGRARREPEQFVGLPPGADLGGEDRKGALRRRVNAQAHQDA